VFNTEHVSITHCLTNFANYIFGAVNVFLIVLYIKLYLEIFYKCNPFNIKRFI